MKPRPGNSGANNITDHITVLDQAIAQLPAEIAAGRGPGDDPSLVRRAVQVRTDSAGCTGFVRHCRARNVGFAVVARSNAQAHTATSKVVVDDDRWHPALRQDGAQRPGADLVDLSEWPKGTRLIVRREPRRPTLAVPLADVPLLGSLHRQHRRPVALDVHMRAHAHVEDNIAGIKDSGTNRFPFVDIDANRAWLAMVSFADALVRWFQLLCLAGPLAVAQPKTLRWEL